MRSTRRTSGRRVEQTAQEGPERGRVLGSERRLPLPLHVERRSTHGAQSQPSSVGEFDELCARVVRVGDPPNVAAFLKCGEGLGDGLPADPGTPDGSVERDCRPDRPLVAPAESWWARASVSAVRAPIASRCRTARRGAAWRIRFGPPGAAGLWVGLTGAASGIRGCLSRRIPTVMECRNLLWPCATAQRRRRRFHSRRCC